MWYVVECMICLCKQKTAYDMRIRDWSSDVCSSDLKPERCTSLLDPRRPPRKKAKARRSSRPQTYPRRGPTTVGARNTPRRPRPCLRVLGVTPGVPVARPAGAGRQAAAVRAVRGANRTEGHTTELQSLMRISYAV